MGRKKRIPATESTSKSRLELRFDDDVFAGVKQLAENAGISVNQLMQGTARWLLQKAKLGEPIRDEEGRVSEREQLGCVWVGHTAEYGSPTREEREERAAEMGAKPHEIPDFQVTKSKGQVVMFLDFTERRVCRDDI